ncbi:MAG: 2-succinyl-6-hydroxy-2,4-cyclohexadiene-1-carboxylate synthase [Thermaerobacter sp.]|nr:2-succinyl-6-hydroxy-2,4-cyclohexadiene-1-carboxylate synthase [Thermaerobacter sp.]
MAWFIAGQHPVLWYTRQGPTLAPAVLLLHGFAGSHHSWDAIRSRLAPAWHVIVPDLAGHGRTGLAAGPDHLALPQAADDLAALMAAGDHSRYVVIGYSLGARLALHLALRHGPQVSALVLESGSPGLADDDARRTRRDRDNLLARQIESRGMTWFASYWDKLPLFASRQGLPEPIRRREETIRRFHSPSALAASLRYAGTGAQRSLWEDLGQLTMPVLILTGQLDRKFCEIGRLMTANIPGALHQVVAGSGHSVHLENPAGFIQAVVPFITSDKPTKEVTHVKSAD